jgi:hypothetical protein
VFRYQLTYGESGLWRIWPKLCSVKFCGQTLALESESFSLNAADTM